MTIVACCQLHPVLGDPVANRVLTEDAIRAAATAGADVIVLPELASSGYAFVDAAEARAAAESVSDPTVSLWSRLANELDVVIVSGLCELDDEGLVRNTAVIIDAAGLRAVYRKAHLWDAERHLFTPGNQAPPVVDTRVGRIAAMVCYDLEFPEWVRVAALAGAQLLCVPTNWPHAAHPVGERPGEVVRAQAAAGANRIFVAACDRVGAERGIDWLGASVILDPDGYPLAGPADVGSPAIVMAQCDLAQADDKAVGTMSNVLTDRRVELYRELLS